MNFSLGFPIYLCTLLSFLTRILLKEGQDWMELKRTALVIDPRRAISGHEIQDLHLPHDPPDIFSIGEILCIDADQAFLLGFPNHVPGAGCDFGTYAQLSGSCIISHNFPDRIDNPGLREQHPFPGRDSRRYCDVEYHFYCATAK